MRHGQVSIGAERFARERFDAVLFDLDGVLTDTASVHAACWKTVFDDTLERLGRQQQVRYEAFDIDVDYRLHVDGKNRLDGARDFLRSRGIEVLQGGADLAALDDTVHRIARRKDACFAEALRTSGVRVFPGSLSWLRRVREAGLRTAVVSASHHAAEILEAAGIAQEFEVRVDGGVVDRLGLPGKPAPDMFIEAARRLGVDPLRAVVVEDAVAGVQAGRAGGFGLVIALARHNDGATLRGAGADRVVGDLAEMLT